jgi:anti-sigma-K factor RskA
MIARAPTQIEELLALRALGGLESDEVAALDDLMAVHGPDCAECDRLRIGSSETATMLAFALDPVDVAPDAADRILAVARADLPMPAGPSPEPSARSSAETPADELSSRRERTGRSRSWRAAVGIAAALVLLFGGVAVLRTTGTQDVSTNWAQTVKTFDGEGELAMAYVPGTSGVVFWGEGLPDPGPGNTYEIWMIDDETPISGGCVTPVDGRIAAFVDADIGTAEQMAVTVEPASCPGAPTSDPIQSLTLA